MTKEMSALFVIGSKSLFIVVVHLTHFKYGIFVVTI